MEQMEIASEENVDIVDRLYTSVMEALHAGQPVSAELERLYAVEHLMQEANSGVSFEHYFRWADYDEIAQAPGHLRALGLDEVAALTEQAIAVAFPDGLPRDDAGKEAGCEWDDAQLERMEALFDQLEPHNGRVTNRLAAYARELGAH